MQNHILNFFKLSIPACQIIKDDHADVEDLKRARAVDGVPGERSKVQHTCIFRERARTSQVGDRGIVPLALTQEGRI